MKDSGIGRPSTYAATIKTLLDHSYVIDDGGALIPTPDGRAVWLDVAPMYERRNSAPLFDVTYTSEMETQLDNIEKGVNAAPLIWETLRDEFRAAHEASQNLRRLGRLTPAQRNSLNALLLNASPDIAAGVNLDALSWEQGHSLIQRLRESGVSPMPSERQRNEIQRLAEILGIEDAAAAAYISLQSLNQIKTAQQASELIEALQALLKPSDAQLKYLEALLEKLRLTEVEACALIDVEGFIALTGGGNGTASQLITVLERKLEHKR